MKKDDIILALVKDYENYLEDFNVEDLEKIANNGVFTLARALEETDLNNANNPLRQKAISVLDLFESLLNKHNITIPSEDREREGGESRLYGVEYYNLEDEITDILKREGK